MKKLLALALAGTAVATAMTGCGSKAYEAKADAYGYSHGGGISRVSVTMDEGVVRTVELDETLGKIDKENHAEHSMITDEETIKYADETFAVEGTYEVITTTAGVCYTMADGKITADATGIDETTCEADGAELGTWADSGAHIVTNNFVAVGDGTAVTTSAYKATELETDFPATIKSHKATYGKWNTVGTDYEYKLTNGFDWDAAIILVEELLIGKTADEVAKLEWDKDHTGDNGGGLITGATANDTMDYFLIAQAAVANVNA